MPEFKFLEEIKFAPDGLIPAIVQDVKTKDVLMMAYMNKEALQRTLKTRETWFYSRSRQNLWHKGESSGHTQKVQEICFDCDQDTLLIKVEPAGPACHKGYSSCFFRAIDAAGKTRNILQKVFTPEQVYGEKAPAHEEKMREGDTYPAAVALDQAGKQAEIARLTILKEVYQVIKSRQATLPEGSYTAYLFKQGRDKICKKIGEEAAEVIIAAKNQVAGELIYESADLLYHLMVLWAEAQVTPEEVMQELAKRR